MQQEVSLIIEGKLSYHSFVWQNLQVSQTKNVDHKKRLYLY